MRRFINGRYFVIIILFFGFSLRLISLNQSFWLDEATSGIVVRDLGFKEIVTLFSRGDFHPPFYYLLLKIWALFFGYSEVGLRSLSIVAGLGSILMVYSISKALFNRKVALTAATLLATSGLHIYYSQEARMYSLAVFFASLSVYLFVKILKKGGVGEWLLFSMSLGLMAVTQYYLIFILLVFWSTAYLEGKNFLWWKKFLASHIIFLIFSLFWFPYFLIQIKNAFSVKLISPVWWNVLGRSNLKEVFLVPVKFMIGRVGFENKLIYGFIVTLLGILFAYLLFRTIRIIRAIKNLSLIWLWLTVPFFASLVVGLATSGFSYFRLLFILPAFYILMAIGLAELTPKWFKLSLLTILFVNLTTSGIYLFNPRFHREDWRGLVGYLRMSIPDHKSSVVVFPANSQMEAIRYYNPREEIKILGPDGVSNKYSIIWLMRYAQPIFDPEDTVRHKIEGLGYRKVGEMDFNGVVVWRYLNQIQN